MNFVNTFLRQRSLKNLTIKAIEILYTEYVDFDEALVKLHSKNYCLLETLVALKIASSINQPLHKKFIRIGVELIDKWKQEYPNEKLKTFIETYKENVELSWLEKVTHILAGSISSLKNRYSYGGTIFELERDRKGPLTLKEKEKWKALCENVKMTEENHAKIVNEINLTLKKDVFAKTKKEIDKKQEKFHSDGLSYYQKANEIFYNYRGRDLEALDLYDKVIELGINKAYKERAFCLQALNFDYDSIEDFNTAIEYFPDDANLYFGRSTFKKNFCDYQGSIDDMLLAIKLSEQPENLSNKQLNKNAKELGVESVTEYYRNTLLQDLKEYEAYIDNPEFEKERCNMRIVKRRQK